MDSANSFLWQNALKNYPEPTIFEAAQKVIETYHYPPSIQQFLEVAKAIERNRRLDETSVRKLSAESAGYVNPHRVSPLIEEYMAKNPLKADDPFKLIFEKYTGRERGSKVLGEIKRQLRGRGAYAK